MVELTASQRAELAANPPTLIDPETRQEYILVRRELYERMCDLFADETIYTSAETLDKIMAEDDANDPGLAELQLELT